ncbi:MAG: patatin-like phospholipase family protein [Blastocatellia bacterium]
MASRMQAEQFTGEVKTILDDLTSHFAGSRPEVSDLLDDAGNQYVDIVMEGGGVLGIALVGYLYVMEEMGIRFLRIGGTSAGSINAMLLASVGEAKEQKAEAIINHLGNLDLYSFVDGDEGARSFIRHLLEEDDDEEEKPGFFSRLKGIGGTLLESTGIWDELFSGKLGLNPGEKFHEWTRGVLEQSRIRTTRDLYAHLGKVPALHHRHGNPLTPEQQKARLVVVTADISTETKVEFPKMAPLYWLNPNDVHPADYVRASMSIPFFFEPMQMDCIEKQLDEARRAEYIKNWDDWAGYKLKEGQDSAFPRKHVFVDGGVMSNFPMDLFHNSKADPCAPTFGVKLGEEDRRAEVKKLLSLTGAVFNSARHCLDYDFITRNPDYRHLITNVDTGSHNWLNFELTGEEKIDLFRRGARAAATFLKTFNWVKYKEIRAGLKHAYRASEALKEETRKMKQELQQPQ